jgi:hypothetical protein
MAERGDMDNWTDFIAPWFVEFLGVAAMAWALVWLAVSEKHQRQQERHEEAIRRVRLD